MYTWPEIGRYLRKSKDTVRAWHKARALPIVYIGRVVCIPVSALDMWLLDGPTAPSGGQGAGGGIRGDHARARRAVTANDDARVERTDPGPTPSEPAGDQGPGPPEKTQRPSG